MSAQLYLFPGVEKAGGEERMRRCAGLFCQSQGLGAEYRLERILRSEKGKPYFPDAKGIFCSVSHTPGYWGCAVSDAPIGLDMEKIRDCAYAAIAKRFFHPEEAAFAQQGPEAFFLVWTAKESYVKLLGQGIDDEFSDFSVVQGGKLVGQINGVSFLPLELASGYRMCLCGKRLGALKNYVILEERPA